MKQKQKGPRAQKAVRKRLPSLWPLFRLGLMMSLVVGLLLPELSFAQPLPSSIHYQGRIRDKTSGELVTGSVSVRFDIYNKLASPDDQTTSYSTSVNANNGLFSVEIPVDLAQVDFNSGPYYMAVQINGDDLGEEPLFGVPYALNADTIDGYQATELMGFYISNQFGSAQSPGDFWIEGQGRVDGDFRVGGAINVAGGIYDPSDSTVTVGDNLQVNGDASLTGNLSVDGGSVYIGNDGEIRDNGTNYLYTPDQFRSGSHLFAYGNLYAGSGATSGSDIYVANRIIDWDSTGYFIDIDGTSNFNRLEANTIYDNNNPAYFWDGNNTGTAMNVAGTILGEGNLEISGFGVFGPEGVQFTPTPTNQAGLTAAEEGRLIYNGTDQIYYFWDGTNWVDINGIWVDDAGFTWPSTVGNSLTQITDSGALGLGTGTPAAKLDIESGSGAGLRVINTDGTHTWFNYNGTNDNYIRGRNTYLGNNAADGEDLYIADRIIDWDNGSFYADFSSDSVFSGLILGGGSSSNWATLDIGGSNSINAAGSIYSYNSVCVGNNSGNCNSNGGTVIGKTNTAASVNITHTGDSFFNTGNLGVGTNTPLSKIAIEGDGATAGSAAINFKHAGNGMSIGLGTADNNLHIGSSWNPESPTYVTIEDGTGNVGIGTTTPGAALDVEGDGYATFGPNSTWGATLVVGGNGRVTSNATVATTNGNLHIDSASGASSSLNYYSQGNTYINARSGNVGIGTTTPQAKLDINGKVRIDNSNYLIFDNTTTGENFGFRSEGENLFLREPEDANKFYMGVYDDTRISLGIASEVLNVTNADVGIGTNAPTEKLDVQDGNFNVSGFGKFGPEGVQFTPVTTNPAGLTAAEEGRIIYNSTDQRYYYWDGTEWIGINSIWKDEAGYIWPITAVDTTRFTDTGALSLGGSDPGANKLEVVGTSYFSDDLSGPSWGVDTGVASGVFDDASSNAPYTRVDADSLHTNELGVGQIWIEGRAIDSNDTIEIGLGQAGGQAPSDIQLGDNNEIFVDTSANSVGIGMNSPSNALHVNGNIGATGWIGAGCESSCESSGGYSLLYANGNIVNTGNTTTSGYVRGDAGFLVDGQTVIDNVGRYGYSHYGGTTGRIGQANTNGLGLDALNDGNYDLLIYESQTYTSNLALGYVGTARLSTYDTNESLTIDTNGTGNVLIEPNGASDGNVGIGTGSPGYKLDVTGDIRATGQVRANANGSAYFCGGDDACLYDVNVANTVGLYGVQNTALGSLRLGSGGATISGSGSNIGIGTTSPAEPLDVVGNAQVSGNLVVGGNITAANFPSTWDATLAKNANAFRSIYLNNNNIVGANELQINDPGEGIVFGGGASGNIVLAVTDDAGDNQLNITGPASLEVGIGTTSPNQALEVAGNIRATGGKIENLDVNYAWNAGGSWNTFTTPSGYISLGPANGGWAHIYSNLNFYFNNQLFRAGNRVWDAGNDGAGSGLDADLIDGIQPDMTPDTIADDGVISTGETNFTNQNLYTSSGPTFADVYTNGWFRNNQANEGLYNQATASHFYSQDTSYWAMDSDNGMILRNGYTGTPTGYLYWSGTAGSNSFGLLSPSGSWRVRTDNSNVELYGGAYMGTAYANRVYDRNNTAYYTDPASTSRMNDVQANRVYGFWDIRSPIFYDYNDTGYYGNFASTSNFNSVNLVTADAHNVTGDLTFTNYGIGVVGTYSSTRYQNLFSMGSSYQMADNGTALNNFYGVAWTHSNVGGESIPGLGHQALFVSAGDTRSAIGNGVWTKYDVTGNRFMDQNNTGYYLDPNTTGTSLNIAGTARIAGISGADQTIENNYGNYLHLGAWGVARTASNAVLVNTAYRADFSDWSNNTNACSNDGYCNMSDAGVGGELYYSSWIRNMNSGSTGLYWQNGTGAGWHIYPQSGSDMRFRTSGSNGGIVGTIGNTTPRGYIHWTTGNEIGFLDQTRNWQLRTWNGGTEIYDQVRSPIYYDSNNTGYYANPASTSRMNRVDFSHGYDINNTGYYIDLNNTTRANTVAANRVYGYWDIRSPIFYDYNNTAYYIDPASTGTAGNFDGNIYVNTPESSSAQVRLGAAWSAPGVYSNQSLYLGSESQVIINDNNQRNWSFDGDWLTGNGWSGIQSSSSSLHLEGSELYLNYYNRNWVNVGHPSSTGYLRVGGTHIYDNNSWTYITGSPNNRIFVEPYFRVNDNVEVNGNIYWGSGSGWMTNWFNQSVRTDASPTFNNIRANGNIALRGNWIDNGGNGWPDYADRTNYANTAGYSNSTYGGSNFSNWPDYADNAWNVWNNGRWSGYGWVTPSDLGVRYANSANTANYATTAGYAYSAGNADTVDGYHESAFIPRARWYSSTYYGNDGNVYMGWAGNWLSTVLGQKAVHRSEGTNYVDYSRYVFNNGRWSGYGWTEPSNLGVRYADTANYAYTANTANYATSAGYATNAYRLYDAYRGGYRTSNDLYVRYAYDSGYSSRTYGGSNFSNWPDYADGAGNSNACSRDGTCNMTNGNASGTLIASGITSRGDIGAQGNLHTWGSLFAGGNLNWGGGWANSNMHIAGTYFCNGADLAEIIGTDSTGYSRVLESGDVVIVHPDKDETVGFTDKAYDSRVAGVISSQPGLVLGSEYQDQAPELTEDGNSVVAYNDWDDSLVGQEIEVTEQTEVNDGAPLALSGRVPVKVTTDNGPIHRGDLLTTSSKPGYAQKANQDDLGFGMVVGKAMTELSEGDGMVIVLVNLQ